MYVLDVGKDEQGNRKQKRKRGFRTKKAAQKEMTAVMVEVQNGTYIMPSKITVDRFLDEWLEEKRFSLSRLTLESYRSYIKNHITPGIGSIMLSRLNHWDIQKFMNSLRIKEKNNEQKLADATIQKIYNTLVTALNYAVKIRLIKKNVSKLVDKPRVRRRKLQVWNVRNTQEFLDKLYDSRYYICFHLALMTGMRMGEILGLPWKNINFDNSCIYVTQTLSRDRKEINHGTKSRSGMRSISISSFDKIELERHFRRIAHERETSSNNNYKDSGLVVCTKHGEPVLAVTIGYLHRKVIAELLLRPIRFHDLRHTHASLLLLMEVHPKIVQMRLGHKSIQTTLDTYSHLFPNMQKEAVKKLEDLLFKPK
ncbi:MULTISPECIES: site-specific integrase [unclassified Paenibacillus]|uniref:site-specific integrase n=1 Tax=unclassified Paenibacillus TaxID=185978 RepID=UPI00364524C4